MLIKRIDTIAILSTYIETTVVPHYTGWGEVGLRAAVGALMLKGNALINNNMYDPYLKQLGILTDDGLKVDMDIVRELLLAGINNKQQESPTIPIIEYSFNKEDIDSLYNIAKNYAVEETPTVTPIVTNENKET